MMPLKLFRSTVFSGAIVVTMVSAFTFYGLLFDLGLLFQRQLGYTPMEAGLAFLPLTVVLPAGSLLANRIADRLAPKWMVVGAFALAASGYFSLMALRASAPYALPPVAPTGESPGSQPHYAHNDGDDDGGRRAQSRGHCSRHPERGPPNWRSPWSRVFRRIDRRTQYDR